ncbi:MAG: hypothetical protein ACU0AU_13915 [Cognatishimia activa]
METPVLALIMLVLVLLFFWLLFSHIGDMARRRGHSPWPWWFLSVVWSPFGSIFVLWFFFPIEYEI